MRRRETFRFGEDSKVLRRHFDEEGERTGAPGKQVRLGSDVLVCHSEKTVPVWLEMALSGKDWRC
jgi:hypothetical protein